MVDNDQWEDIKEMVTDGLLIFNSLQAIEWMYSKVKEIKKLQSIFRHGKHEKK